MSVPLSINVRARKSICKIFVFFLAFSISKGSARNIHLHYNVNKTINFMRICNLIIFLQKLISGLIDCNSKNQCKHFDDNSLNK